MIHRDGVQKILQLREGDAPGDAARWFILDCIRQFVRDGKADGLKPRVVNRFLRCLSSEHQSSQLHSVIVRWSTLFR